MKKASRESGAGAMRGFFAGSIARPVATLVALATLIVLGLISYKRIQIQLLPSGWQDAGVQIWIVNRGASAQENDEQVARVIEAELRTLSGISQLRSWSGDDGVELSIGFQGSIDLDLAKAEVRDRIERARPLLPATIEEIGIWSEDADQLPITFFGILMKGDPDRRDHLMDKVVIPRMEAIDGIGKVTVWGVLQDSVRVLLDEDEIAAARLDIGGVIRRLSSDNFALPMGEVRDGGREIILRSDMRFTSPEEVAEFPIGNGLKLKDVGRVARIKSVRDWVSRIDGAYAYYGMATKDSQANVVETSRNLKRAMEELRHDPALASNIEFLPFFVQGEMIESALGQLRATAAWGGALAVVVLFVFLRRVRLTLCVALSIPVSALMAIVWEYFTGGTFNVLTMTGITLGIGMLVDNAVVMVENIARIHREGERPFPAAIRGARQVALAVTLATLTTVVVFLPLIFMTENPLVRALFGGIGIPLAVSLLASLLVAVVFLPVIAARILGGRSRRASRVAELVAPVTRLPVRAIAYAAGGVRLLAFYLVAGMHRLNRLALAVLAPLRWPLAAGVVALAVVRWRDDRAALEPGSALRPFELQGAGGGAGSGAVIVVAAALAVGVLLLGVPRWRRRQTQAPRRAAGLVPAGESLVDMLSTLNHTLVAWTLRHRFAAAGLAFLAFASIAVPNSLMEVTPFGEESSGEAVSFRAEFDTDFTLEEVSEESYVYEEFLEARREKYGFAHLANNFSERSARISMYWDQRRPRSEFREIYEELKRELPRRPGHRLRFYDENQAQRSSNEVVVFSLVGPDADELERLGARAARILEGVPGLSQVSTPLELAPDEVQVVVERDKAHRMGVDADVVTQTIAWTVRGFALPRFQERGRDIPFLIELDEEEIAGVSTLRDLSVFGDGTMVPLSTFADLAFTKGKRRIHRRNGKISFSLEAKVDDPLQVIPVTERAYLALEEIELPRGYSWDRGDSARTRQEEEFKELGNALILSIVLVFLVMGILFESVLLPFSVLVTIPFAITGSMWTLFLTGRSMDFMGWIGMIILAGVVVNNGIVLVDRIHRLRADLPRPEAVLTGCAQRVRPVLMTALTTVCGLLPMMVSEPPQDGIDYRALATIVAGGLVASTFFTLWVVPLAYTVIDDLAGLLRARGRWWLRPLSLRPARAR